jgi:hypothetical protein
VKFDVEKCEWWYTASNGIRVRLGYPSDVGSLHQAERDASLVERVIEAMLQAGAK